jgi:hypothetical protein
MKFKATIDRKGKLDVKWDLVNTYLSRWKIGTILDVEIVRRQKTKSDPMRKMYFAKILPDFANSLGYDPDEYLAFHDQLKIVYFSNQPKLLKKLKLKECYKDEKNVWRNVPHVFHNDSKLPISEKTKFVDWVLRKAAIEGIYIETKKEKTR